MIQDQMTKNKEKNNKQKKHTHKRVNYWNVGYSKIIVRNMFKKIGNKMKDFSRLEVFLKRESNGNSTKVKIYIHNLEVLWVQFEITVNKASITIK